MSRASIREIRKALQKACEKNKKGLPKPTESNYMMWITCQIIYPKDIKHPQFKFWIKIGMVKMSLPFSTAAIFR